MTNTVRVAVWSPSVSVSSIPVTVTVCGVSQSDVVNVNAVGATVTSPVSPDDVLISTSDDGWVLRTTVNVSVPPASVVTVEPSDSEIEIPGESSSEVVTVIVWSDRASNALSLEASTTETVTAVVWLPSVRLSSTPVISTYWDVDQFADVNVNVAGDTVASPVSADDTSNTTSEVGCAVRTMGTITVEMSGPSATVTDVPDRV